MNVTVFLRRHCPGLAALIVRPRPVSGKHLKLISVANASFWTLLLIQIPLLWNVPLPEPGPDHVREFAQHYRVTASLELLAFVAASITFSALMWARPRRWVALVLASVAI